MLSHNGGKATFDERSCGLPKMNKIAVMVVLSKNSYETNLVNLEELRAECVVLCIFDFL